MEITFYGRHMAVTEGLKAQAEEKLARLERYFARMGRIQVRFETPDPRPSVSVVVPVARGGTIVAEAEGADYLEAVGRVVEKLERQLKRYKARLREGR